MSEHIIVAGAGHGGLVAAAKLSAAGYDVAVYEKLEEKELGHDWEDRFTFSVLEEITGVKVPEEKIRTRGDCAFVSPSYNTRININFTPETRHRLMWRKDIIAMLIDYAKASGVKMHFGTEIKSAIIENGKVSGIRTDNGDFYGDLIIDAAGVFSPVRRSLPEEMLIEKDPRRGDVFYAWRAYFNKTTDAMPSTPFEVYLKHAGEPGLSWCCTFDDAVDVLIGRIDPVSDELLERHIERFRRDYPFMGETIINGGYRGVIPVRRPLALMVAPGYAAVGDSAFMTTPMNGMGIDLSLNAGNLLAECVSDSGVDIDALWKYNKEYHRLYGGIVSKNEGLKNALITLPKEGVDFLFDNAVIQSSDLAGAGQNLNLPALLGKFVRGMKNPPYFFAIIKGLMKGAKIKRTLENAPENYDLKAIKKWQDKIL